MKYSDKSLSETKDKYIILWVLFFGYLIFNGILLWGHELWRDEANVWLLARDTTPWQLFGELKYQGHPCLWYLIVMPFAKLGLPFPTISILSFVVMAATAGIFVRRAPFSPMTKAICLFSPMFSYYYPVVARNYCLIALFLILLAYLYPRRNENCIVYGLMLGLLVQTDTIALIAAGLISVMWMWEGISFGLRNHNWELCKKTAKGLWIPLVSLFLLLLQFIGVSESPEYDPQLLPVKEMVRAIFNCYYNILARLTGRGGKFILLITLLFLVVGVLLSWKLRNLLPMIVAAGVFMYQAAFSVIIYRLHIWHNIVICFALIWFLWLGCADENRDEENPKQWLNLSGRILAEVLLISLGLAMFLQWNSPEEQSNLANAWNGIYSDGIHVADYISEYVEEDELIICTNIPKASTVSAYLGKDYTFYYAATGNRVTFARYNESKEIDYEKLLIWVKDNFPENDSFYLLENEGSCIRNLPKDIEKSWDICYQTVEETARGENYILYRVPLF